MTIRKMIGAVALMGLMASANAASISLVPTTNTTVLNAGDLVSFDIVMDFSDQATIGGGFDILFDSSVLAFDSLVRDASLGDPSFSRDPDVLDGLLDDWVVSAFSALPATAVMGSVDFVVLATLGMGTTTVEIADARNAGAQPSLGGFWVDAGDFVSEIPVQYNSVDLVGNQIPVPAAVWFMLSGLGALIGFGRKAAA